jgi:hypothetical protein
MHSENFTNALESLDLPAMGGWLEEPQAASAAAQLRATVTARRWRMLGRLARLAQVGRAGSWSRGRRFGGSWVSIALDDLPLAITAS